MLDNYIDEIREELNVLTSEEGANLNQGEILVLSKKLDKLIFIKQTIVCNRLKINYIEQLHNFLSPALYAYIET